MFFQDSVKQLFIEEFIDTMDVELLGGNYGYVVFVRVDSGATWYYQYEIEKMWNVLSVAIFYNFGDEEKDYLSIRFNDAADANYINGIIDDFSYLYLENLRFIQPMIKLRVEIGKENYWTAKFEEYPFVDYAEQAEEYCYY